MMKMKFNKNRKNHVVLFVITLVIALFLAGCTTVTVFEKKGIRLMRDGKYDAAVKHFEEWLKTKPSSTEIRTMLFKAKLNSYYYHLALARKWREQGKKEEAVKEYKIVLGIFPGNKKVRDELDIYLGVKKEERKKFKSTIEPPVRLNIVASEKISLNLRNTPIKQIFKMLGKASNINFIFDKDFRDFVYTIEIEDIGFFDILNQLCMVSNTKYRILDPSSVLIYTNTTFKRKTFGLQGVKVFFLANTDAEDVKKLVLTLFRDQQIQVQEDTNMNSLIIKGSSSTLMEIERFLHSIDREKGELEIDLEILELNRNLINSIGLVYEDTLSTVSMGTVDDDGTVSSGGLNVNTLGDTNFFITLPSAALNFLETDDNTKIISKPNLRGVDGEEIQFMVGDEIPIPNTQFQAGAAGGVTNVPVTTYQYKSVGVDVKITPFIHRNREVTLQVKLKIDFITGYRGDFPTLGKRVLESTIRLKEGETSIIGGLIKDEMRGGTKGMPALAKLPLLGKLFGVHSKTVTQTDLVFSITPRVIRQMDIEAAEQGAIWSDTEEGQGIQASEPPSPRDPDERMTSRRRGNTVIIAPPTKRVAAGSVSYFTLRVNSSSDIASLSINGSVSGPNAEIEEIKTEFFGKDNSKVLKNTSGGSFDLGYTFETRTIRNSTIAQLKIKFIEKGNYTISLGNITAYTKDRKQIELTGTTGQVEVYETTAPRQPRRQ
jgi:type II secretory pathway component GspD/PulD (secretin)